MSTTRAEMAGRRVGRAIAQDAIASGMPRKWTGLDDQDGDQFTAAGIEPNTEEWADAEQVARREFLIRVTA
jgi:hypothetical protein